MTFNLRRSLVACGPFLVGVFFAANVNTLQAASNEFEGTLEQATCQGFHGWVWDASQPDGVLTVEVQEGKAVIASFPADKPRTDLVKAKKGNGKHGFEYSLPGSLIDGKPHSFTVSVKRSHFALGAPNFVIACRPTQK